MKKFMTNIKTLAALLMAGAAFTACSSSDDITADQPAQPAGKQVYTLTIKASKGDATTRGLSLDGNTLNAIWKESDKVMVYSYQPKIVIGELTSDVTGSYETTLTGNITGTINVGDKLVLEFLPDHNYSSQVGTLAYIEANCDYADATVEVTGNSNGQITTQNAVFTNHQAIVKFTLLDAAGSNLNVKKLTIDDEAVNLSGPSAHHRFISGAPLTITPDNATTTTNVFYAAISNLNRNDKYSHFILTATDADDNDYIYTKEYDGQTSTYFEHGQYYTRTVKMKKGFTKFKVGDVIKVGDKIRLTEEWEIDSKSGTYIPDYRTGTLVRADINDATPKVTETENGAYYVIKYVYRDFDTYNTTPDYIFYFFDGMEMPVTENSDGIKVTSVTTGGKYPICTFEVHQVQN